MSSEVYRYKVGDIGVTVLSDGFRITTSLDGYILNVEKLELLAALAEAGLPTDHMKNVYTPVLIETGGRRVLIDTGIGESMFEQTKGERGRLLTNLAAAGFDRNAIDAVVISHFHPDHVNGLLMADGTPAFANAEILVPEREWVFWMDDGEMGRASEGRMAELFHNNRRVFDALDRKVTRFAWDSEVAPGVTAVGTPGHSIGHTSFAVSSGTARVFVQGDVNNQSVVFSKNPEWQGGFDHDPVEASATRRRVYAMLAAEKTMLQAYHHPFPGLAQVEQDGTGFRVVPIA
ncbi:MBL fold metallo-hydrolase [Neorhizobium tomejilense]|uniref:MBL fold metallo-hydrolase n=1 Tax=Neorhizobium tomejilense TaxID=2093828 RepID=UPI003ECF0952